MRRHVLVLGAGFGGLEVGTRLGDQLGDEVHVTVLDAHDSFVFGFSKLELLCGRQTREQVSLRYADLALPGVEFRQERVLTIDRPPARW